MPNPRRLAVVALVLALAVLGGSLAGSFDEEAGTDGTEVAVRWPIPDDARSARVVRVVDGDTVVLDTTGHSRLVGVDTPEVHGERGCFGEAASDFAKRLLPAGRTVRYVLGEETSDRYGRALVTLWLTDGRSVNGMLVAGGYATTLTIPPNDAYQPRLEGLQRSARSEPRGLWRVCSSAR